jgi:hypothetical protein
MELLRVFELFVKFLLISFFNFIFEFIGIFIPFLVLFFSFRWQIFWEFVLYQFFVDIFRNRGSLK